MKFFTMKSKRSEGHDRLEVSLLCSAPRISLYLSCLLRQNRKLETEMTTATTDALITVVMMMVFLLLGAPAAIDKKN